MTTSTVPGHDAHLPAAQALITSEVERAPVRYSDNLWADAAAARPDSLLDLAARQRPCSEELAALQLQAVDVMRAQVHLDLRGVHIYGCFTEKVSPMRPDSALRWTVVMEYM